MCQRPHKQTPERKLEAHHIRPKAIFPEKAYDLGNGIALCWRCHRHVVHATWGNWATFRECWDLYRLLNAGFNADPPSLRALRIARKAKKKPEKDTESA